MNSREPPGLPPVVIIAGPTASGKSALALELASAVGGTIINADSMQVYRELRILTARPGDAALMRAPHRLYGYLDVAQRGSVADWRDRALREIDVAHRAGRVPMVIGGSGLYLHALRHGLAPVPPIPAAIRSEAAELYQTLGGEAFRERLGALDPMAAARLPPGDRQRLLRAYEVSAATGVPLAVWHRRAGEPAARYRFATILVLPPRAVLYAACDARFRAMVAAGGLAEARALAARHLDPLLPAMKALGMPDLQRHLRGEIDLGSAMRLAMQATRRYAKRQVTWFRHQLTADLVLEAQLSESLLRCSRHFIDQFLLTGLP